MFAFVPTFRALGQRLVITLFILLDETLQADVTPHVISEMIALKEKQQSGYPSVPIPEGMDAEEVEIEGRHCGERVNPPFFKALLPEIYEFVHGGWGLIRRNGFETDPLPAIGIPLDDIAVLLFISSGIPNLTATHPMEVQDGLFRYRKLCTLVMDELERIAVPSNFFLVAVPGGRFSKDNCPDPCLIDRDPFNSVRRDCALNHRILTQNLQPLG
jgi:hypothetical protein